LDLNLCTESYYYGTFWKVANLFSTEISLRMNLCFILTKNETDEVSQNCPKMGPIGIPKKEALNSYRVGWDIFLVDSKSMMFYLGVLQVLQGVEFI
jgi:hypothetical protein